MASKEKKHFTVSVDAQACKGCGYCQEMCPKTVYEQGTALNPAGYAFMASPGQDNCVGCLTCVMVCPDFAITVAERI
jgi:NAD-dependent dihydropyrimidine dehydrogenase PreA subunit